MEKINLRSLDIKVDKTELSKVLKPETLREYVEYKGWKKKYTSPNGGYDVYEYFTDSPFTVMIPSESNWLLQEEYLKAHDLRENFLSLVAVHYISEFEILEGMFDVTCEKEEALNGTVTATQ